jgi:hypothetical protein
MVDYFPHYCLGKQDPRWMPGNAEDPGWYLARAEYHGDGRPRLFSFQVPGSNTWHGRFNSRAEIDRVITNLEEAALTTVISILAAPEEKLLELFYRDLFW